MNKNFDDFWLNANDSESDLTRLLDLMENDLEKEKHYFNPVYYLHLKCQLEHARRAETHRLPECIRETLKQSP
jgi:hypothetical protein